MPYLDINSYGIIGDMRSCALVGRNGSIDWACFPRFDSPSIFGAILDDRQGGRFQISPVGPHSVDQRYLLDTNILETAFSTPTGTVIILDFMPMNSRPAHDPSRQELHRIVRGIQGSVELRALFQPRFDYARGEVHLTPAKQGVVATNGSDSMALISSIPLTVLGPDSDEGPAAVGSFSVAAGDEAQFIAAYGLTRTPTVRAMDSHAKLEQTKRYWQGTVAKIHYHGPWHSQVVRSFLALHLLVYRPTGAIVAAPTTSLPEHLGGERNWDYRYSWLRDGAWTVGILYRLGDPHEGQAFVRWLTQRCWLGVEQMQILHGIHSESSLHETTLDHLEGYKGSKPVRVGNEAAYHRQLDVYGEMAFSLATYHKFTGRLPKDGWKLLRLLADLASTTWHTKDRSIWEVRGAEQHFVYSKIMCWVALDRAVHIAKADNHRAPIELWRAEADKIKAEVLEKGWSEEKQSFVQHFDTDAVDASALIIPFVGFLPPDDPRIRSTVHRIIQELSSGAFVKRYLTDETDDGLKGDEGAFVILSFWLIGALLVIGETEEATWRFKVLTAHANHLGLFAEMVDTVTGKALGNFPQAFSHIGFLHTAINLGRALQAEGSDELLG